MSLTRMTPARLAANRANAKRATAAAAAKRRDNPSPTQPRNFDWGYASAYHAMPPDWHAHAVRTAASIAESYTDPLLRHLIAQHVYSYEHLRYLTCLRNLQLAWALELYAGHVGHAIHHIFRWGSGERSYHRAKAHLSANCRRASKAVSQRFDEIKNDKLSPYLVDSPWPPKTLAAAASASTAFTHRTPTYPVHPAILEGKRGKPL
jgi:hypothetical protein